MNSVRMTGASMLSGLNAGNQAGKHGCHNTLATLASMLSGLNAGNQVAKGRRQELRLAALQCCPA